MRNHNHSFLGKELKQKIIIAACGLFGLMVLIQIGLSLSLKYRADRVQEAARLEEQQAQELQRQKKVDKTTRLAESWVGFLETHKDYVADPVPLDLWNQPLRFEYNNDLIYVLSAGPDENWDTKDDIMATGKIKKPKKSLTERVQFWKN